MTTISAKVVLDSISSEGKRLTTVHMRYPRFIHAELMTHRVFSRNARSSRAVPVKTMLEEIRNDPVVPLFWGKNQKGMQASEECNELVLLPLGDEWAKHERVGAWLEARDKALEFAEAFMNAGYHKQVVNRLLEPFMHIDTLVSSTEWANFFHLRDHTDAEPHIDVLAKATKVAFEQSGPQFLNPGEWHLPYITKQDLEEIPRYLKQPFDDMEFARRVSAARCARISYAPFDGDASYGKELQRFDDLVTSQPVHASPVEHQATPDTKVDRTIFTDEGDWIGNESVWETPEQHGNFIGWRQFRKMIPNEAVW